MRYHPMAIAVLMAVTFPLLGGCDDDGDAGPGPVGPIGPTGIEGDDDAIEGSGTIVSEDRSVSDFTVVVLDGEGTVVITEGSEETLTIEADDNLLTYLEATVDGSELRIATTTGIDIDPTETPEYRVTIRELKGVELGGAGSVSADGWTGDSFEVNVTGVGGVTVSDLSVVWLVVDVGGVATVTVSGTAQSQDVTIQGIGEYSAADLESRTAVVDARGTGVGTLWVVETLQVKAQDSAQVLYYGAPSVTSEVGALGTVQPLGNK